MPEPLPISEPHFSLRYTFTYRDLNTFNAIHDRQPEGRRLITIFLAIMSLIAFGGVYLEERYLNPGEMDWRVWLTVALVYSLLFWAFRFPVYRLIKKMLLPLLYKMRGYDRLIGVYQMDFSDETLTIKSPVGTHIYEWDKIVKAVYNGQYLVLYITKMSAYPIPLSTAQFVAGTDARALLEFVRNKVTSFRETPK